MEEKSLMFQGLVIFCLIFVNAAFVIAEYAIVRVRSSEINTLASKGNLMAMRSKEIINNLDKYISATQLGITFVNLLLGWIGEDVFIRMLQPFFKTLGIEGSLSQTLSIFAGLLIITYLTITIGELAPKAFAIRKYLQASLWLSYPLIVFYKIFKPFIWILNTSASLIIRLIGLRPIESYEVQHTEEEIRQVIKEGRRSGVIDQTELRLIENIFEFNDKKAREIMVPRNKMSVLNIDDSRETLFRKVTEEGYSRFPVYKDTIDNIVGVIHSKDLIPASEHNALITLQDIVRSAYFVSAIKQIGILLSEFQKNGVQLGIVVNEFGGIEGLITMEDILEEIVGEIKDEYDIETPEVIRLKDNTFFIDPIISIKNFNTNFETDIPTDPYYNTIGGFLCKVTGHIPEMYERIDYKNLIFIISKKQKNTIKQIKVKKN
jgi:CBS domain containing-hemolysin-like protein